MNENVYDVAQPSKYFHKIAPLQSQQGAKKKITKKLYKIAPIKIKDKIP